MTPATTPPAAQLPEELLWLADAPLFIDRRQVESFYDAVVRPAFKTSKIVDSAGKDVKVQIAGKATTEVKMSFSSFWASIAAIFPSLEGKVGGEVSGSRERVSRDQTNIELVPIETPERQLLLLTLHYIELHHSHHSRFFIVRDPSNEIWRTPEFIRALPRGLIFLELPGQADAVSPCIPTMLIPTAAEFEKTGVEEMYSKMPGYEKAGKYPEDASSLPDLRELRRRYWLEFQKGFSATKAMAEVEKMAKEKGRLRWIDFRLPITDQGDTLHLHVCPVGEFDTGVFAYNLIKRGYKHGVRMVGTLKSEPDMNVLAIYER
jgi:hypothetical protein